MGWSMTKPKRKKKRKEPTASEQFRNIKGAKREQLIAARKAKGLNQAELSELVGCSSAMISSLETGRAKPGLELSLKLETVLDVPYTKLFEDF